MTTSISRRTILPALVATAAATGVGVANASPTPTSLISLETIKKANDLIRDRERLIECVRGIPSLARISINVPAASKKSSVSDRESAFASIYFPSNLSLNEGYDPDFKAIRDAIHKAAVAQLGRVEAKMTALGIDFESGVGSDA